jgi:hypothetical protein
MERFLRSSRGRRENVEIATYVARSMRTRRCVYLHGLGTGPASSKARALAVGLGGEGVTIVQPDLRQPSPAQPRLDAMFAAAEESLAAGPVDLLVGASLGGWMALHLARRSEIGALLLLAPALSVHALDVERPLAAALWRTLGLLVHDKADRRLRRMPPSLLGELRRVGAPPAPRVPVRVVHGRGDRWVRIEASRRFGGNHPEVGIDEVDDGHDLAAHHPLILARARELLGLRR